MIYYLNLINDKIIKTKKRFNLNILYFQIKKPSNSQEEEKKNFLILI